MSIAATAGPDVRIDSYLGEDGSLESMAADVRAGLTRKGLKEIPPKYFYDTRGSELFDRITRVPEYYPTRCERAILNRRSPEIVAITGARELVELGSGTASKTRALLYAMAGAGTLERYVPVDVSEAVVQRSAAELIETYPGLRVHGLVGDFERHLDRLPSGECRLLVFLGGTIGNFYPAERARFFARIRSLLEPGDHLLLGVDLVKDIDVLEAAYNDAEGVTAEFNRNVLHAINRDLRADFEPLDFEHVAFFDPVESWIEMRLRAAGGQRVRIDGCGLEVVLEDGEEIRTEISTKFTPASLAAEFTEAGLCLESFFTDPDGLFGLSLASPA
jgi:L-histidine N-alpha-methyltransferase